MFLFFDDNDDSGRVDARDTLMMLMTYNWKSRGPRGPDFKLEPFIYNSCDVWCGYYEIVAHNDNYYKKSDECKPIEKN